MLPGQSPQCLRVLVQSLNRHVHAFHVPVLLNPCFASHLLFAPTCAVSRLIAQTSNGSLNADLPFGLTLHMHLNVSLANALELANTNNRITRPNQPLGILMTASPTLMTY